MGHRYNALSSSMRLKLHIKELYVELLVPSSSMWLYLEYKEHKLIKTQYIFRTVNPFSSVQIILKTVIIIKISPRVYTKIL
jgi:hypothetical protein